MELSYQGKHTLRWTMGTQYQVGSQRQVAWGKLFTVKLMRGVTGTCTKYDSGVHWDGVNKIIAYACCPCGLGRVKGNHVWKVWKIHIENPHYWMISRMDKA